MSPIIPGCQQITTVVDENVITREEINREIDRYTGINGVFKDKVDRKDRSYRRKTDDRLWLYGIKPGFSDGEIKLPPGLVQGQKIGLLLTSLTLPVAEIESFDDLPIPFRAIAADIQTGEKVVLDSGNLAKAIRASMAVPAALSPVPWEGRRLVDGGIASNLPVETVKEMGADIIIAVDLGEPLSEHELGESLLSIVDQLTAMLVVDNVGFKDADEFNQIIAHHPEWRMVSLFSFLPFHSPENDGICLALREG